jgi:hypothetical protein
MLSMAMTTGVAITPKHFFGVNSDLKQSLFLQNDQQLIYVAGHNIVVYKLDEKSQYFLPGKSTVSYVICFVLRHRGLRSHHPYCVECRRKVHLGL